MPQLTEEQVKEALRELAEPLVSTALEAWSEWKESPQRASWFFPRGRSEFVWETWTAKAVARLDGHPRLHIERRDQSVNYLVDEKLLFRLKRGDANGISANYPTASALAFHDQDAQVPLLPDVDRVEVVYQPDDLNSAIVDVRVVARDKARVVWSFSLAELAAGEAVPHAPNDAPQLPMPKSLVVPKHKSKDEVTPGSES